VAVCIHKTNSAYAEYFEVSMSTEPQPDAFPDICPNCGKMLHLTENWHTGCEHTQTDIEIIERGKRVQKLHRMTEAAKKRIGVFK
jgi:hypothetical protein